MKMIRDIISHHKIFICIALSVCVCVCVNLGWVGLWLLHSHSAVLSRFSHALPVDSPFLLTAERLSIIRLLSPFLRPVDLLVDT